MKTGPHPLLRALPLAAAAFLTTPVPAQQLYVEAFDSPTGAKIRPVIGANMEAGFVDYSSFTIGGVTHTIPEAPHHVEDSAPTKGYLLRNLYNGTSRASQIFLADGFGGAPISFSGNYRLRFDMYLGLAPNATPSSAGTTEMGLWGIGNDGINLPSYVGRAGTVRGVWGWLTVDGGISASSSTGDAVVLEGSRIIGRLENTRDAGLFSAAFGQGRPLTNVPNNQWVEVDVVVYQGDMKVRYNGITFVEGPVTEVDGFAFFGYEDGFTGSTSFSPDHQFALFDNVRVNEAQSPDLNVVPGTPFVTQTSPGPVLAEFAIENFSDRQIIISAINISGANAADFRLETQLPLEIPSFSFQVVRVAFDPSGPNGVKNAVMEVVPSDQTISPVTVPLQARRAIAPLFQAHYKMDESSGTRLTDSSGNDSHATLQVREPVAFGAEPLFTGGGNSICFLPANSSTTGNYATSGVVHSPSTTLSAWIRPQTSDRTRAIFNRDPDFAGGDKIYGLALTTAGNLRFRVGGQVVVETGDDFIQDENVYHVVVTHLDEDGFGNTTASRTRLYVNGQMVAEKTGVEAPGFAEYPFGAPAPTLHIGSRTAAGSGFRGCMDDIQIYSRELSPQQVLGLFQNPGTTAVITRSSLAIRRISFEESTRSVTLEFASDPGRTYRVQASADLRTWTDVASSLPSGGAVTTFVEANVPAAESARFYRVAELAQ